MLVPAAPRGLIDIVTQFFGEDNWQVAPIEGRTAVQMGFIGRNGAWRCYAQTQEERRRVTFYSILDVLVPDARRLAVAEFITRANYGLIIGNFELDFNDGEVRFKTSLDIEGGDLSTTMVRNLVYANLASMDRYLPGLRAVIEGTASPAEAVQQAERG
jgi:hypothetical protein